MPSSFSAYKQHIDSFSLGVLGKTQPACEMPTQQLLVGALASLPLVSSEQVLEHVSFSRAVLADGAEDSRRSLDGSRSKDWGGYSTDARGDARKGSTCCGREILVKRGNRGMVTMIMVRAAEIAICLGRSMSGIRQEGTPTYQSCGRPHGVEVAEWICSLAL